MYIYDCRLRHVDTYTPVSHEDGRSLLADNNDTKPKGTESIVECTLDGMGCKKIMAQGDKDDRRRK
jgi:hypothetical protein